eukprot:280299-Chlamydomonas_euryale.AAC.4
MEAEVRGPRGRSSMHGTALAVRKSTKGRRESGSALSHTARHMSNWGGGGLRQLQALTLLGCMGCASSLDCLGCARS